MPSVLGRVLSLDDMDRKLESFFCRLSLHNGSVSRAYHKHEMQQTQLSSQLVSFYW